jgi:hypothetical protein
MDYPVIFADQHPVIIYTATTVFNEARFAALSANDNVKPSCPNVVFIGYNFFSTDN